MAPVRFGSVRLRFGDGTVRAVPVFGSGGSSKEGFLCVSVQFKSKGRFGSGFGSWKTVPAVPVPLSVSGKTVPTVPVSGSGSVPQPPCYKTSGWLGVREPVVQQALARIVSRSPKTGHNKAGRSDFRSQRIRARYGENVENAGGPSEPRKVRV